MANSQNTETFYREIISQVWENMKDEYNKEGSGEETLILWKQQSLINPRRTNYTMISNQNLSNQILQPKFKYTSTNSTMENIQNYYQEKQGVVALQQFGLNSQLNPNIQKNWKFYTSNQNMNSPNLESSNTSMLNTSGIHFNSWQIPSQMEDKNLTKSYMKNINNWSAIISPMTPNNLISKKWTIKEDDEDDEKEDQKSVNSEEELFANDKVEDKKDEEANDNDEEVLSPYESDNEGDVHYDDLLWVQYEKVHRVRSKWKVIFKDAIWQHNSKEYIFEKIVGELDRDW